MAGTLQTMSLPDVLQFLAQSQRTGTLEVRGAKITKSIFFRDGAVISAASTDPKEFLGHFLVSHGFIDEKQLARAVRQQEIHHMLIGMILVNNGDISQTDVETMLRLKAEEGIYDLFTWDEGDFEFHDGALPEYDMVPITLQVQSLLMEGMQRIDEWSRLRELVPSIEAIPVAMVDELIGPKDSERDRRVLELIDDVKSVEEICLHLHSSEFVVTQVLHRVASQGKIKLVRPRTIEVIPNPDTSAASLLDVSKNLLGKNALELAYRYLNAARSLQPDGGPQSADFKMIEARIRTSIKACGLEETSVPKLVTALAELSGTDLSPQEGFIVSRIDGATDLKSIIKISPLQEMQALLAIWKLVKAGHVVLKTVPKTKTMKLSET